MEKSEYILQLHDTGMRNSDIARLLDLSRQRVSQVLHKSESKARRTQASVSINVPLTVLEASALLRLHPNTIRRWAAQEKIPCFRLGTRRDRRFKAEDIKLLLKK